ncbi:MAG: ORF1 protein [Anelloviridae sp.]|nr:MAG: ORF1 protein [Anelloviridae sp.]
MPFYRRWRRWRRRPTRFRRRPFRAGLQRRRYTRRRALRAKVRRRPFYKRKRRVKTILQWQPPHQARCRIKGWKPMFWGYMRNSCHPFQYWNDPEGRTPGHFTVMGGGAALHHFTLSMLYDEYLHRRNVWSHSNDGFDLAKYNGTKIVLHPHEDLSYIFWWESDFLQITPTQYHLLHPAISLNHRNHKVILSRKLGNRRKTRVFVQPPSTMTTTWAFMSKWCNIPLFRMGFTLANFYDPFMHATISTGITCLTSIKNLRSTYYQNPDILPQKTPVITSGNNLVYKWWWDDGVDNKIGTVQKDKLDTETEVPKDEHKIYHTDKPYWLTFYGAADDYIDIAKYYVYIWWYEDTGKPEDIWDLEEENRKRCWTLVGFAKQSAAQEANEGWRNIAASGPFIMAPSDTFKGAHQTFSLAFQYTSYWKWGGVSPQPTTNLDPCTVTPTTAHAGDVQVRNPRSVGEAVIHPWDLNPDGFISKYKLRELFGFSPGTVAGLPPETLPRVRRKRSASEETEHGEGSRLLEEDSSGEPSSSEDPQEGLRRLTKLIKRNRDFRHKLRRKLRALLD